MTNLGWRLVELLALQLSSAEREVVLGDLTETRATAWQGMREVSGLIVRRQLQLWKGWRPWLAAFGLTLPCSLVLMGFSFTISIELRNFHIWERHPSFLLSLVCQVAVLLICSWTAGFTIELISRGTFAVSAACCVLPCLSCMTRFHEQSLPRFCILLFLLPAIAGIRHSKQGGAINLRWGVVLAMVATLCMTLLAAHQHLWLLNWELIAPAWYLAFMRIRSKPLTATQKEAVSL